ncbi:MAG TPA: hypothetical protein VMS17_25510 [Gemmataceae bacterium]|nr:hypothetical protein [Gemmataceae bacterium]
MQSLIAKLWTDDRGAVVSAEVVLVISLTVIGIIPGLVALRNAENASLADIGNALLAVQTSFSFAGFSIVAGGTTIATVGGVSYSASNTTFFTSAESNDNFTTVVPPVNPAP